MPNILRLFTGHSKVTHYIMVTRENSFAVYFFFMLHTIEEDYKMFSQEYRISSIYSSFTRMRKRISLHYGLWQKSFAMHFNDVMILYT